MKSWTELTEKRNPGSRFIYPLDETQLAQEQREQNGLLHAPPSDAPSRTRPDSKFLDF